MSNLRTIIEKLERFAPPSLAQFDFVGLLQGEQEQKITKIGLTLDYTVDAINQAIMMDCNLLITHHGPTTISYPISGLRLKKIKLAAKGGLGVYRSHLSLDFCEGGIISTLCELLNIPAKPTLLTYQDHTIVGGVYLAEHYPMSFTELLKRCAVLNGKYVRVAGKPKKHFSRIAITSGQGFKSEFFEQLKPDVYIAGEFEQEATKYAEDMGIMLIELGHHASEHSALKQLAKRLSKILRVEVVTLEVPDTIHVIQKGEV